MKPYTGKYWRINAPNTRQTTCPKCGALNVHTTGKHCGHVAKVTAKGVVFYYWAFDPSVQLRTSQAS